MYVVDAYQLAHGSISLAVAPLGVREPLQMQTLTPSLRHRQVIRFLSFQQFIYVQQFFGDCYL